MVFDGVGLVQFRYLTTIVFIPFILYFHCRKGQYKYNLKNLFKSNIAWGFFLLSVYMSIYAFHIGQQYEIQFLNMFLFPGFILFIIGATFFFKDSMYKDFFYGILFFSILTMLTLIIFSGIEALSDRTFFGKGPNISAITQGQMSGLVTFFSLLIILNEKGVIQKLGIPFAILGIIWLSLTGTRGALVSILTVLLFYLFFISRKGRAIKYLIFYSLIIFFTLIYYGITESLLFYRASELLEPGAILATKRFYRWILFFDFLPDNFVFGLGPGGWGKYVMIGEYRYPHNIIIEFILMYGIAGIVSFFLIFFTGIKASVVITKDTTKNLYFKAIALAWIFYLISAMFSGSFIQGTGYFFTYSSILISTNVNKEDSKFENKGIKL